MKSIKCSDCWDPKDICTYPGKMKYKMGAHAESPQEVLEEVPKPAPPYIWNTFVFRPRSIPRLKSGPNFIKNWKSFPFKTLRNPFKVKSLSGIFGIFSGIYSKGHLWKIPSRLRLFRRKSFYQNPNLSGYLRT